MVNYSTLKRVLSDNWRQWLPIVCITVFSLLIFYSFWQTIHGWFFSTVQSSIIETTLNNQDNNKSKVPVSAVPQWHIFGLAPNENMNSDELPKTTLHLQLIGIMQANDANYSQAVIAGSDGQAKIYRIGEQVPGGAKIKQILPYSVILERAGIQEKLELPRKIIEFSAAPKSLF